MQCGEVWWVDFDPSVGGEIEKQRPAVIISNDASNVERLYPSEAYVMLNGKQYKALADQLTTVSKLRLSNIAGRLLEADLQKVEQVVKVP